MTLALMCMSYALGALSAIVVMELCRRPMAPPQPDWSEPLFHAELVNGVYNLHKIAPDHGGYTNRGLKNG